MNFPRGITPKISEAEARALLSRPLRCAGDFAWISQKSEPPARILSAGIVDHAGRRTNLAVKLIYTRGVSRTRYLFSVFLLNRSSTERVYQLEVSHTLRKQKDAHAMSHEHIGDRRQNGAAVWQHWSYDEVLAYFCAQTNISFAPLPPFP
ncbi:hypothetical protein [Massilia eurypsychrophila]|uniref:hypothetical protein n=1 Tax=Massilia eurypsychrophila TaxID=1485217 RepID=UPI0015D4D95A|nr:hypothetical protein [Massilia eurypsychrophila]